jgi:hypothetical protein
MSKESPRKPSPYEIKEIARWLAKQENEQLSQDHIDRVEGAYVAVFDDYISDGPGYAGRVMVCIWSGAPELVDVFTDDIRLVSHRSANKSR